MDEISRSIDGGSSGKERIVEHNEKSTVEQVENHVSVETPQGEEHGDMGPEPEISLSTIMAVIVSHGPVIP